MTNPCACGCGGQANEGKRFIFGHHLKLVEFRKPRGPNKKRKYTKRSKTYWQHKKENNKITSYVDLAEIQKDIEQMKHTANTQAIMLSGVNGTLDSHANILPNIMLRVERLEGLFEKLCDIFVGIKLK